MKQSRLQAAAVAVAVAADAAAVAEVAVSGCCYLDSCPK